MRWGAWSGGGGVGLGLGFGGVCAGHPRFWGFGLHNGRSLTASAFPQAGGPGGRRAGAWGVFMGPAGGAGAEPRPQGEPGGSGAAPRPRRRPQRPQRPSSPTAAGRAAQRASGPPQRPHSAPAGFRATTAPQRASAGSAVSGFPGVRFYRQRTALLSPTFLFPAILACIPTWYQPAFGTSKVVEVPATAFWNPRWP